MQPIDNKPIPLSPLRPASQNRVNLNEEDSENRVARVAKRTLSTVGIELEAKRTKIKAAVSDPSLLSISEEQISQLVKLLSEPKENFSNSYTLFPFSQDVNLQNPQSVLSFMVDLISNKNLHQHYLSLLIFLKRFQKEYQPSPHAKKLIATLFIKMDYGSLKQEELFEYTRLLKEHSNMPENNTRYLLSRHAISAWSAIFQALSKHRLNENRLSELYMLLKSLILAENFDELWVEIETSLYIIIKNNLDCQNWRHSEFVPNFLYDLATQHPQIKINNNFQDFLFKFLFTRNQREELYISPMYTWGIFAHFTDATQFPLLGKDFIVATSARYKDLDFNADTDPNVLSKQFAKEIYRELTWLNKESSTQDEFDTLIIEFLMGFSLFGTWGELYLTEESKTLLCKVITKASVFAPLQVLTFLRQVNANLKICRIPEVFAEYLIEEVARAESGRDHWKLLIDLSVLVDKEIIPPRLRNFDQEINNILRNTSLNESACETTILTLEALALLSRKKLLGKLNDPNIEKIKSVFFNKGEPLPFSSSQKIRLGLALLELHKTNPTLPVLWFTAGLPRFIQQREDVGTKARFMTK